MASVVLELEGWAVLNYVALALVLRWRWLVIGRLPPAPSVARLRPSL